METMCAVSAASILTTRIRTQERSGVHGHSAQCANHGHTLHVVLKRTCAFPARVKTPCKHPEPMLFSAFKMYLVVVIVTVLTAPNPSLQIYTHTHIIHTYIHTYIHICAF